ncbi:protein NPGR2-like [Raphanus sativus]|uniref:Protein NPGR2-like n=1 Tax=Raphanus sativus TaxID=3726 RepID=A0A6J0KRY3_RAPSA|nr:protein NPGR2-like [Raphanus sativus]XP_056849118.1 protein NPGR2-like [Raphanus sativus]
MECLSSGEQMRLLEEQDNKRPYLDVVRSALSAAEKIDNVNIDQVDLSLRETSSLNYEEASALLGRIEYQKGNIEAALRVFERIDINGITIKMKTALTFRQEPKHRRRRRRPLPPPPMSKHAVSILFEAIFLKAKSLQRLGRFQEAAQSCGVILDIVEASSLSEADVNLKETLAKAAELLPQLWKLADSPRDAVSSYRRALLNHWDLDPETTARIQREYAVFLLYSGEEAASPNLRSQSEGSFIPRSNVEEAILLLMLLLRKVNQKRIITWDAADILDHLTFALTVAGDLTALAKQLEELSPEVLDQRELYHTLSLCYHGAGEDLVALGLLRKLEDPNSVSGLLMASKICGERSGLAEEGVDYARRAMGRSLGDECVQLDGAAHLVLGVALTESSRGSAATETERVARLSEGMRTLESADMADSRVLHRLALENAEERKLDSALAYAKQALKLGGESDLEVWLLLARVLSAQKRFSDAESVVDAAVNETGKWEQGKLLRLKAKLRVARGEVKDGIETYAQLLALLRVQSKSLGSAKNVEGLRSLELGTWHDLAHIYINLSQWRDAETCLKRSRLIAPYSPVIYHTEGVLYKRRGQLEEAMEAFITALDIDPMHVPSLISKAEILLEVGNESSVAVVRSFLMEALRIDRLNHSAWYTLGKMFRAEGSVSSMQEAVECFQAAVTLEETMPVEPFR